jgi:hypothetical protein
MSGRATFCNWRLVSGAILAVAVAAGAAPHPAGPQIARNLEEVYDRPEFLPPRAPSWIGNWLNEKLRDFFFWLASLHSTSPVLYYVLLVGCLVTLALLLFHIGWTIHRAVFVSARGKAAPSAASERTKLSARFHEEALLRAQQEDYTEAIRCLFLSLVYLYDESGRVSFRRAYTNREYLGLFAQKPDAQAHLKQFVDTIDDHWYGVRPTQAGRYEECLALYESLT